MFVLTPYLYYRNRAGRRVWVAPNTTRWFDGLPFVVCEEEGRPPQYTVDDWGRCYPDDYGMFRDSDGWWQPHLFEECQHPSLHDIVELWKDNLS